MCRLQLLKTSSGSRRLLRALRCLLDNALLLPRVAQQCLTSMRFLEQQLVLMRQGADLDLMMAKTAVLMIRMSCHCEQSLIHRGDPLGWPQQEKGIPAS
mmetsp:Transcript_37408/g.91134  ORF Transcript_37408/g.91134 Transcript_37408/m.91134 type:complete len:99 (+) Transcript_37408:1614-1910(+)